MWVDLTIVASSIFGQELEIRIDWISSVLLAVIVRAMGLLTFLPLLARIDLIGFWMILLLFPSMTITTPVLILASI